MRCAPNGAGSPLASWLAILLHQDAGAERCEADRLSLNEPIKRLPAERIEQRQKRRSETPKPSFLCDRNSIKTSLLAQGFPMSRVADEQRPVSLEDPRLDDLGAPVEVRRHPKARRLTLRVSRTRRAVIVTLPSQCDLGEAGSFVHRHIDWVRERLGSLPDPVPFEHRRVMPLRGKPHRIVFIKPVRGAGVVKLHQPARGYEEIRVAHMEGNGPSRLRNWLFRQARRDLEQRVSFHAKRFGVQPKKLTIRDQTSRWGSCSSTGALSFSWRLVMAPPFVLDYVAAHEVAHLREMNHGPRFWALVDRAVPRMEEAKNWLQIYGMDLHRYGVTDD
jgi:predicted metal-dependent hydrolase